MSILRDTSKDKELYSVTDTFKNLSLKYNNKKIAWQTAKKVWRVNYIVRCFDNF